MSGGVGKIVDAVGKGFKYAAAFGAVFVASAVSGGAAAGPAKALLGRMAGAGGITGAAGRGIQGMARSNAGQALQSSAKAVAGTLGAAGIEGTIARAMMTNALHQVKTHTGVDLEGAHKDVSGAQKEYLKYAGEEANKIGPAQIDEEIKRRNETMGNLEGRASEKMGKTNEGKKMLETLKKFDENNKALTGVIKEKEKEFNSEVDPGRKKEIEADLKTKQAELDKLTAEKDKAKAEKDKVVKEVGNKKGYDVEEHDKKIDLSRKADP